MTSEQDRVLKQWRESAEYWAKHTDTIREMFMPLTLELIHEARIVAGQSVLDVAGGAGEPSLTIAKVVGPTGQVTCTDAVQEMVDAARREAEKRGITNVVFQQCTADALPFDNNSFDGGVCRLGAMFFPDPLVSVKEILRVLKPGGHLAFVVWYKDELNPFTSIPTNIMSRYAPYEPSEPEAMGAFRFAEFGKLVSVLKEAGATDTRERLFKFEMSAPISSAQFWEMRSQTSDTLRKKLRSLSDEERAKVANEVQQAVEEFFPNNQMRFPAQMLVVSGVKSRTASASDRP